MRQTAGAGWWGRWLRSQGDRRTRTLAAHQLYDTIVRQARQPIFYAEWGVPDTRGGRLELVNLHAILVFRSLRRAGKSGEDLAQTLFDLLFADLDRHLREWGVGDLSVGKHVKKLAESFFGRAKAIDQPLDDGDRRALETVLERNVFDTQAGTAAGVTQLADYLVDQDQHLARSSDELVAGRLTFASISEHAAAGPGGAG